MRLSLEQLVTTPAPLNYLSEAAYDYTKWNLGKALIYNAGASPIDKYIAPDFQAIRPLEESTPFAVTQIFAYNLSTEICYIFGVENLATAVATRRVALWELNRKTGARSWKGFITMTLATATAHTVRDFKIDVKDESTGTVQVAGTAVTGTGTQFATNKVAVGARIGFGSTDPSQITTWYRVSARGSDTGLTLATSAGTIAAGTDYVIPSALSGYVPTSRTITINGTTQNLSTDITYTVGTMGGSGTSGQVAYFNGTNSITSEGGFIYDSSTNRLGVNTSVPNATIGADSALDSGYGLLIKTGASNYNGIGIAIDSTYGNLISTEKLGTASARNLTLLNQSGFVSLRENGNFGVNTLNPAVSGTGIDIYGSTSTGLRFHTATSGTTVTDGAGINFSAANNLGITNYEAGAIDIVTNGNSGVYIASNGYVGINGASGSYPLEVNGGIRQTSVTSALVKTDSVGLFPKVHAANKDVT